MTMEVPPNTTAAQLLRAVVALHSRGPTRPELVYFIRCQDAVKIGAATDPRGRLRGMQAHCPYELSLLAVIPGGVAEEQRLHKLFAKQRIRGEWFHLDGAIADFLAEFVEP